MTLSADADLFPYASEEPFWTRAAISAAAGGAAAAYASRLFAESDLAMLVWTTVRLWLAVAAATRRRPPLALLAALAYPYDMAFLLYFRRPQWLPESVALELGNPTAFLIFMAALLLLSLAWAEFRVPEARRFRTLLFLITAGGAVVSKPEWSVLWWRYAAEPAALALYAACAARALPPERTSGTIEP